MTSRPRSPLRAVAVVFAVVLTAGCTGNAHRTTTSATPSGAVPVVGSTTPGELATGSTAPNVRATGSNGPNVPVTGSPPRPTELTPIDPATLRRFYGQQLRWSPCAAGLECASLTVPLDYAQPSGPTVELAVVRHRSDAARRIGSVVLNPGGPGGSGVQYVESRWQDYSAALDGRFDVVSFDPRGVGESEQVRCVTPSVEDQFVAVDVSPTSAADIAQLTALDASFAAGCKARSGALLPHVGTLDTARDLDILRAALGDSRLTYVGKSYGTFLGAIYAQLFPTHVRAMVLDGAVDPSLDDLELGAGQAKGFETALHSYVSWCVAHTPCPVGTSATSATSAEPTLDAWLAGLVSKPLKDQGGRRLTAALAIYGIAAALYDPRTWPTLSAALGAAMSGSPSRLLQLADALVGRQPDGTYTNDLEASVAISCADRGTAATSIQAAAAAAAAAARETPTFGGSVGWGNTACIGWPAPAELAPGPVEAAGAPPILVIGTLRDPATPVAWAKALAGQLRSGVLLTWDGDGHTAFLRGSTCIDRLASGYLIDLAVPASGTACGVTS